MSDPFALAAPVLASLYRDTCDITVQQKATAVAPTGFDDPGRQTVTIAQAEPCKLSRSAKRGFAPPADGPALEVAWDAVLFVRPDLLVPTGARVTVTDSHGRTRVYRRASGDYTAYQSHQEVPLAYQERE